MLKAFIGAMRPIQWVKNVFVLAPLVFGLRLTDPGSLMLAAIAFGLFCLVSSAVYFLNDLSDRDADQKHPTKRFRPIASGELPVEVARPGMVALVALALGLGVVVDVRVALILLGYFVLNVAYTMQLKKVAFLDIGCIALGFLLRVLAGGLAIDVKVSSWLLACTFLLASLLALGKRKHELAVVMRDGKTDGTRAVLENYVDAHIDWAMRLLTLVTTASYAAYALAPSTSAHFGTDKLFWTLPFVILGLARFFQLVNQREDARSPTDLMVRDAPFLANMAGYVAIIMPMIYFQW